MSDIFVKNVRLSCTNNFIQHWHHRAHNLHNFNQIHLQIQARFPAISQSISSKKMNNLNGSIITASSRELMVVLLASFYQTLVLSNGKNNKKRMSLLEQCNIVLYLDQVYWWFVYHMMYLKQQQTCKKVWIFRSEFRPMYYGKALFVRYSYLE